MGAGKAADACTHNGNALIALWRRRQLLAGWIVSCTQIVAIGRVALQCADGDRFVDLAAPAVVLAGVCADAAKNVGEWIVRTRQQVCFLVLRDPDGLYIASTFGVNRAGSAARNILVEIFPIRDRDGVWHAFSALAIEFDLL